MKIIKKLNILLILFLLIFLTCCKNKDNEYKLDNDINLYREDNIELNDLSFKFDSAKTYFYDDNVLEFSFKIRISNNSDEDISLRFSEPKAYGKDLLLEEEILTNYNHENKDDNVIFKDENININKKEFKDLSFYLIIQDGNSLCKYKLEFKLNNVTLNIYSYFENYEYEDFYYVHNPLFNQSVLDDAEYDANCVFGFKPNNTGSLKTYAVYDWTNLDDVLIYKENRIKYIEENDKLISELEKKLRKEGKEIEDIAIECSYLRNKIRLNQYKDDPEGLEQVKQRNLEKYGHEDGPTPDELYLKYGSWEIVLKKCYQTNRGMDACCGVYDMYFNMYTPFAY